TPLKRGKDTTFGIATETGNPPGEGEAKLSVDVERFSIRGPLDGSKKDYPWHIRHIFSKGPPPQNENERDPYRREILTKFVNRAFRRPVDEATVERLVKMARDVDALPGNGFEDGIAEANLAVLVSPRFLLRAEVQPEPDNPGKVVDLDEYALASRLSYFLWSSLPDEELMKLAGEGALRQNLRAQVDRMLKDPESDRMIANFVGQWLQARDVEAVSFIERVLLREAELEDFRGKFTRTLRRAMRQESEMFFAHI